MEEEVDGRYRSRKKGRTAGEAFSDEEFPQLARGRDTASAEVKSKSYRDSVMAEREKEKMEGRNLFGMELEEEIDTGFDKIEELSEGIIVDCSEPRRPNFILTEEEHRRLCIPFAQSLVVKLVGKTTTLATMKRRIPAMWGKKGRVSISDVENGYYIVGFQENEDYLNALTGGPWTLFDSYLSVMRWREDFDPRKEEISKIAVWVRLPGISLKFYDKKFLWNVGNVIGRVLRVDMSTALRARGMYARLCVEVDLTKPLLPHYAIDGQKYQIEYESMGLLCLKCGRFGHLKENCKEGNSSGVDTENSSGSKNMNEEAMEKQEAEKEGPWKVVQKVRWGRRAQEKTERIGTQSRFSVLEQEEREEEEQERPRLREITNKWIPEKRQGPLKFKEGMTNRQNSNHTGSREQNMGEFSFSATSVPQKVTVGKGTRSMVNRGRFERRQEKESVRQEGDRMGKNNGRERRGEEELKKLNDFMERHNQFLEKEVDRGPEENMVKEALMITEEENRGIPREGISEGMED